MPRSGATLRPSRFLVPAACAAAALLPAFLAACAPQYLTTREGNYLTFEYPFTDAAAEDARRKAVELCGARKLVAVRSENVCSLTKCTTSYQCIDKSDATIPR